MPGKLLSPKSAPAKLTPRYLIAPVEPDELVVQETVTVVILAVTLPAPFEIVQVWPLGWVLTVTA